MRTIRRRLGASSKEQWGLAFRSEGESSAYRTAHLRQGGLVQADAAAFASALSG